MEQPAQIGQVLLVRPAGLIADHQTGRDDQPAVDLDAQALLDHPVDVAAAGLERHAQRLGDRGARDGAALAVRRRRIVGRIGVAQFGIVNLPSAGILIVFAAIMRGEEIINVLSSLATEPGCSQMETLSTKRDEIQEFQEESFLVFRSIIQAEIDGKPVGTIADE